MSKIITYCYNEKKEFNSKEEALAYFKGGMNWCDPKSHEHSRYACLYDQIYNGATLCFDDTSYDNYCAGRLEIDENEADHVTYFDWIY